MQLKSDMGVRCWPVTTSTFVVQPNTEARFDRDSWLVAAAAAAYVGIALILMLIGFRFPSDGWHYDDFEVNRGPLAVRNIGADASALRPGDVVIRVDGQALPSLKTSLRPAVASDVWHTGGTTRYTVIRDAQTLELDVAIQPQPVTTWWRYLTGPDNWIDTIASLARLGIKEGNGAIVALVRTAARGDDGSFGRPPFIPAPVLNQVTPRAWQSGQVGWGWTTVDF